MATPFRPKATHFLIRSNPIPFPRFPGTRARVHYLLCRVNNSGGPAVEAAPREIARFPINRINVRRGAPFRIPIGRVWGAFRGVFPAGRGLLDISGASGPSARINGALLHNSGTTRSSMVVVLFVVDRVRGGGRSGTRATRMRSLSGFFRIVSATHNAIIPIIWRRVDTSGKEVFWFFQTACCTSSSTLKLTPDTFFEEYMNITESKVWLVRRMEKTLGRRILDGCNGALWDQELTCYNKKPMLKGSSCFDFGLKNFWWPWNMYLLWVPSSSVLGKPALATGGCV